MFRLEKLEISGFKSFADRTSVLFGEGITCVVGPNGCGKSNIAEAISWVLGEQSAKSLRGGKMEDVIFSGTRDRKPTGMAEVTLTMVATADVTARDAGDQDNQDDSRFDAALDNAQRASEAAQSIIADAERPLPPESKDGPELEGSLQTPVPEANPQIPEPEGSAERAALDGNHQTPASEGGEISKPEGSARVTAPDGIAQISVQSAETQPADSTGAIVSERSAEHPEKSGARRKPRQRKKLVVSAGERITIGRRLYRTGDSDYLMNGRLCLLRDVQDLFAGTGLGGAHYAIIEQGKIGQILSSKPLDRRALIEEAAGITKFKSRKRLAELKLESAKQNLTRVNDITSEVERQVNSLKRQAQKARRYKRLRDEMRSLLRLVYTADYYRISEACEAAESELDRARARHAELDGQVAQREAEHKSASMQAREIEGQLASLREDAAAVQLEVDRIRNRRAFEQQQVTELTSRMDENSRSQQALTDRLSLLDGEMEQRVSSLKLLQTEVATQQSDLIKREGEYQAELARLREAETGIERLRQRLIVEIGVTERLRNNIVSMEDALRRLELKQAGLDAEGERAAARREETGAALAELGAEIEADALRIDELVRAASQRLAGLEAIRQETQVIRSELDTVQAEKAAAERLLNSLEEVDEHHRYFSDAVQQLLSPEQSRRINAIGTLADFVEVDPQYERLIESLFGRELQCVLVPTIDDALAGIEYLKTEGLGRGAFLVVGLHGAEDDPPGYYVDMRRDEPGSEDDRTTSANRQTHPDQREVTELGIDSTPVLPHELASYVNRDEPAGMRFQLEVLQAVDLMGLRPEIRSIVARAFPEKCSACVVPDVEAALHLSMENGWKTYITYGGDQVVNGRLIVSAAPAGKEGASLLGIKRQIKDLKESVAVLGRQDEQLGLALVASRARLELAETDCNELDARLRQEEKDAAARASRAESLGKDLERAEQHVRVVEAEREIAFEEHGQLQARAAQLQDDMAVAEGSRNLVQHSLAAGQAAFAEMRVAVERFAEQLSAARASAAARAERLRAAQAEMRRLEREAEELNSRINIIRVELYESQNRVEELKASSAAAESETARLEAESSRLAQDIGELSGHLGKIRSRVDELDSLLSNLRQDAAQAHENRGRIAVELAKIQSEAEHLVKSCFNELGQHLKELISSPETQALIVSGTGLVSLPEGSGAFADGPETPEMEGASPEAPDGPETRSDAQSDTAGAQPQLQPGLQPDDQTPAFDLEAARQRLGELRTKLDDMGSVNMMALEELEESEQRFRFLSTQRDDILKSIKGTEEALAEIKRRSREKFRDAFLRVNENFQKMFVELFGGGRGEMILIDEEDVLESGIDLIAQPPGKRLQNVLLLSGGEKAMAAIALVLSIFQYRPSPFCILDEVDAPLDEMNVGRFSDKVVEMSRETQFLMITHNKRSMESARALYGVTMEEPGVSKLVSVRFE
jgi:chromosome segregation protein